MNKKTKRAHSIIRLSLLGLILSLGIGMIILLQKKENRVQYTENFEPLFQIMGESTKSFDNIIGKMLPIDDMDEKDYGELIASYYREEADLSDPDYIYLNSLIKALSTDRKKNFQYRVFIEDAAYPNAMAFPGGVIVVTRGMLDLLETESQLVAILAHERGHIELSHCFNAVKYQLALDKTELIEAGELLDLINASLLRTSFSKNQETEADDYAFNFLLNSSYDPMGLPESFIFLKKSSGATPDQPDIMRDYLSSHPSIERRIERYSEKGKAWWEKQTGEIRYRGAKNLKERIPFHKKAYMREWIN